MLLLLIVLVLLFGLPGGWYVRNNYNLGAGNGVWTVVVIIIILLLLHII